MLGSDRRLFGVAPGEGRAAACAFAGLFCVLASYYVLRPVRDAMGIVGNVADLSRLFLVTLAVTLACTPLLAALVSRWPRRRCVPIVYRSFAGNLVVFWLLLRGGTTPPEVARVFFVWTSVFNLFALSLFWSLMADLFRREQGVRLFGLVGAGGTLGAMAGSFVTSALVERVGVASLVLASAVLLEVAVRSLLALRANVGEGVVARVEADAALADGGAVGWLRRIPRSPYLLAIVAYMLVFTFTSTGLYFEQARIVKANVATSAARTALFAKMDLGVNVIALGLQSLVAGPVLRRLGVGLTLALLPIATLAGFVVLGAYPTLAVVVAFQVARRAADYGVVKPSREVLFTVVSREDKYKAKSFIDTFVYRLGDALGALTLGAATTSPSAIVVVAIVACVAWVVVAAALGRMHVRASSSAAESSSADGATRVARSGENADRRAVVERIT